MPELDPIVTPEQNPTEPPAPPTAPEPKPEPPKSVPKPDPATPKVVTKKLFDDVASELAETKRQLKARMSADELSAAEAEEARMELETLRREKQIHKVERELLKSGIENSTEIAELFVSGDTEKAIAALTQAKDAQILNLQKEITTLKQRGALTPPVGEAPEGPFAGKSLTELMQMANESPAKEAQILKYLESTPKKE